MTRRLVALVASLAILGGVVLTVVNGTRAPGSAPTGGAAARPPSTGAPFVPPESTSTAAAGLSSPPATSTVSGSPGSSARSASTAISTAAASASAVPVPRSTPPPPAAGGSLAFPIRAAFYYPWYPTTWGFGTHYHPTLGQYDSGNPGVIAAHVAAMQGAGIQAGIASWWGPGTVTDQRIPLLLRGAGSFRWALYYEAESLGSPTLAQLQADLAYILARYAGDPAYLRVGGRPVLFVYGDATDSCATSDTWRQANAGRFYVDLKVFSGYRSCPSQPDGWHQYAPAVAVAHQLGSSFAISPGFYLATEASPRLARDLARWRLDVAAMKASGEPWQLVTTFNEWGEGTAVESATEWGNAYLDALAGR